MCTTVHGHAYQLEGCCVLLRLLVYSYLPLGHSPNVCACSHALALVHTPQPRTHVCICVLTPPPLLLHVRGCPPAWRMQADLVVRAGEAALQEPLPPEVLELTRMAPDDFAAQWRQWHQALKTRYQLGKASGWTEEASEDLSQHVAYLVRRV